MAVSLGLVNGSIGHVVDLVYLGEKKPPYLPDFIIIQLKNSGAPFVSGSSREKWVPILPY